MRNRRYDSREEERDEEIASLRELTKRLKKIRDDALRLASRATCFDTEQPFETMVSCIEDMLGRPEQELQEGLCL